ncbi:MAG: hypothetical protein ACOY94_11680 [Bacillota bacterium]
MAEREGRERRRTQVEPEFTQYMEADAATVSGGNTAHGNSPRNQGVRLTAARPEEERPEGE